jgi:hypothetical protein
VFRPLQSPNSRTESKYVNKASKPRPPFLWSSTHNSRPKRVASPYSAKDFHLLHHAGFDRRFPTVPVYTQFVADPEGGEAVKDRARQFPPGLIAI